VNKKIGILQVLQTQLKNPGDLSKAVEQLIEDRNELQKTAEKLQRLQAQASVDRIILKKQKINHLDFYNDIIVDGDINLLKMISSELRIKDNERSVALLISKKDGKVNVLIALSDDLVEAGRYDANKIIKEKIAPLINGGGGGQKFLATASGTDAANIDRLVDQFKQILNKPF
jgi:alanyl-tRNA synthetase